MAIQWVRVVVVSPDSESTKTASGSSDKTACVWSLLTGQRLLGPGKHGSSVFAVKLSPDGYFISLQPRLGCLFGSTIVGTAAISSMFQSEPPTHTITHWPGQAIANTSLLYLPARLSLSTPPLVQHFSMVHSWQQIQLHCCTGKQWCIH